MSQDPSTETRLPESAYTATDPTPAANASGFAGASVAPRSRFDLARFRRVTTSGQFIPQIDGLRFVAIALVVVYHLRGFLRDSPAIAATGAEHGTQLLRHGHFGVQLFFVISGFILALPFASHRLRGTRPVSLRTYFLRRLTRLEPPYVLSMLLLFAMLVLYVGQDVRSAWPHLVASLLYVHNLAFGAISTINGVAWSLEIEIQFYVLVPLLAHLFAIPGTTARRLAIVGLMLAAVALQAAAGGEAQWWIRLSILGQLQFFLGGFLLADVYLTEWEGAPTSSSAWDLVSLAGWPLLVAVWESDAATRWTFPLLAVLLYVAAFRGAWSRRVFGSRWLTTIGGMCYTIYLLHYPIISFLGTRTARVHLTDDFAATLLLQLLLVTPPLLAACAVYFVLIERPCMRPDWPQRLAARLRALPLARSAA